ncbi:MAG TPA: hypothetical protein VJS30_20720 [Paraburkholderia sp.]|nr:hypothetical protein [Paraburkholderia sp.]
MPTSIDAGLPHVPGLDVRNGDLTVRADVLTDDVSLTHPGEDGGFLPPTLRSTLCRS